MKELADKFRHAFAVGTSSGFEPTPEQRPAVELICREVVRRRLTAPALLFLEMSRPLNSVGAALMQFFNPLATVLVDPHAYRHFSEFLEHRGSLEHLCRLIERFERDESAPPPTPASPAPRL